MNANRCAFLDMIAVSELGRDLLAISDNGYDIIVGSTPVKPIRFSSYADHPRRIITVRPGLRSSAAGRYQILARYFDAYKKLLKLPDFSPSSQDAIALQMIREQGAIEYNDHGNLTVAVAKCANIWASLPGAGYGQHEHKLSHLVAAFEKAGGKIA